MHVWARTRYTCTSCDGVWLSGCPKGGRAPYPRNACLCLPKVIWSVNYTVFDGSWYFEFDKSCFVKCMWAEFYPDTCEPVSPNVPELQGWSISMSCFIKAIMPAVAVWWGSHTLEFCISETSCNTHWAGYMTVRTLVWWPPVTSPAFLLKSMLPSNITWQSIFLYPIGTILSSWNSKAGMTFFIPLFKRFLPKFSSHFPIKRKGYSN